MGNHVKLVNQVEISLINDSSLREIVCCKKKKKKEFKNDQPVIFRDLVACQQFDEDFIIVQYETV